MEESTIYWILGGLVLIGIVVTVVVIAFTHSSKGGGGKSCDASHPPANGGVGTCTTKLSDGSTCQPTCYTGYTVSGTTSCKNGRLTAATCTKKDACDGVKCGTHGKCVDGTCKCDKGWTGVKCGQGTTPSNPCDGVKCGNHGKCVDGTCKCDKGWTGVKCGQGTTPSNPCDGVKCGNHGKCVDGTCKCDKGWTGVKCGQGTTCDSGYSGTNCDTADPCTASADPTKDGTDGNFYCINGGTAGGTTGSCTCTCDSGYSGTNCNTADPCTASTDPTKDGTDGNFYCVNGGTAGGTTGSCTCTCDSGYSGTNCTKIGDGTCTKDAQCTGVNVECNKGGKCQCKTGWFSNFNDGNYSPDQPAPCELCGGIGGKSPGGGTSVDNNLGCKCQSGFEAIGCVDGDSEGDPPLCPPSGDARKYHCLPSSCKQLEMDPNTDGTMNYKCKDANPDNTGTQIRDPNVMSWFNTTCGNLQNIAKCTDNTSCFKLFTDMREGTKIDACKNNALCNAAMQTKIPYSFGACDDETKYFCCPVGLAITDLKSCPVGSEQCTQMK